MITINPATFVTDVMKTVDFVLNGFVQSGYEHLVQNNQAVITLMMTAYIALLGYKLMAHTLEMEMSTLARHVGLLILVYALITQWNFYYIFFYNIFTNEPGQICKTLIDANANVNMGGESVADALNTVFVKGMDAAKALFKLFNFDHLGMIVLALLVFIATILQCLVALAILIYAKFAIGLALLLGPIFIAFLLWNPTREFFNKWVQMLVNYALIPVITCGILMLTLSVTNATLPGLSQNVNSGDPTLTGISVYIAFSFVAVLLYMQILPMCAALSGGMALGGLSIALPLAKQMLQKSGVAAVASKAGGLMRKGAGAAAKATSGGIQKLAAARAKAARDRKFGSGSGKYY